MKRLLYLFCIFVPFSAHAAVELEIDPFAFALKGHSFHIALAGDRLRADWGSYGLVLDKAPGNPDFKAAMNGSGLKLDYLFVNSSMFAGVTWDQGELALSCPDCDSSQEETRQFTGQGIRLGMNLGTNNGYLSPWLGVSKVRLKGGPVQIEDQTYQPPKLQFFPTIHLGYRF